MLEIEPIVVLLLFGLFSTLLASIKTLPIVILKSFIILFWLGLGVYWGIYLAVSNTLAPYLAGAMGLALLSLMRKEDSWFYPPRQSLFILLVLGAYLIDSLAFWQRYDLFTLAFAGWYFLAVGLPFLDSGPGDRKSLEGLIKFVWNHLLAFSLIFSGQVLLMSYQTEALGTIYHSGWGLAASLFFLIGWVWLIGLWPLHGWLTDLMESLECRQIFYFFMIRAVAFFWLCRMWLTNFPEMLPLNQLILGLASLGFIWSALLSLMQTNVQRLIAYGFHGLWSAGIIFLMLTAQGMVSIDWLRLAYCSLFLLTLLIFAISQTYMNIFRDYTHAPITADLLAISAQAKNKVRKFYLAQLALYLTTMVISIVAIYQLTLVSAWKEAAAVIAGLLLTLYSCWKTVLQVLIEGVRPQS